MRCRIERLPISLLAIVTCGLIWNISDAATLELDFDYFKNEIQPIFLAKRPGNVACVSCHGGAASSNFHLQPLSAGRFFWDEAQSRKNFEAAKQFVTPGTKPLDSRLLSHPLARDAGGDPFHGGGKHWSSQADAEWQIIKRWTEGASVREPIRKTVVRIVQTNSAGDNVHVIDPATNKVAGVINDIQIPHGVVGAPDGRALYVTNESLHTLDVVDSRTLRVWRRVPLSGRPNNLAITKDGAQLFVGIMEMPGSVDVVDTATFQVTKTIEVDGAIHNVYVTPDGRYAVAGSIQTRTINVIDIAKQELLWKLQLESGIRPMAFDTLADGSTKNIYVQLSNFHGFVVVDFAKHTQIAKIEHPPIANAHAHYDGLQGAPAHGLAITPDGKFLWSTSKVFGYAYVYALPDLREVGRVFVGQHPEWIAMTPDGKFAYIGAAGDNQTFVIDVRHLKEIARIPVGQVPKRNATVVMALP